MIDCPMCGYRFGEAEAERSCVGCPMSPGCHLLKCPRCGYEVLREPRLVRTIKTWRRRHDTRGKGPGDTGDAVDKE
jgi:DNA-directed RNA polymerase subunit RPC12/RpoP